MLPRPGDLAKVSSTLLSSIPFTLPQLEPVPSPEEGKSTVPCFYFYGNLLELSLCKFLLCWEVCFWRTQVMPSFPLHFLCLHTVVCLKNCWDEWKQSSWLLSLGFPIFSRGTFTKQSSDPSSWPDRSSARAWHFDLLHLHLLPLLAWCLNLTESIWGGGWLEPHMQVHPAHIPSLFCVLSLIVFIIFNTWPPGNKVSEGWEEPGFSYSSHILGARYSLGHRVSAEPVITYWMHEE